MSIFIDNDTRLIVQGITGRDGSFHTKQMIEYGTKVVGGVTPGKGGQKFENQVPIFNTVHDAVKETGFYLDIHRYSLCGISVWMPPRIIRTLAYLQKLKGYRSAGALFPES